jgi:hypothetical protein
MDVSLTPVTDLNRGWFAQASNARLRGDKPQRGWYSLRLAAASNRVHRSPIL